MLPVGFILFLTPVLPGLFRINWSDSEVIQNMNYDMVYIKMPAMEEILMKHA